MRAKRYFGFLVLSVLILSISLSAGCGNSDDKKDDKGNDQVVTETSSKENSGKESSKADSDNKDGADSKVNVSDGNDELMSGKHHIDINVADYGVISVELDADTAPITVTNFVNLIKSGFYDGLTFHRIMDGFMIQGGDPLGNGLGGAEVEIEGEFAENGHKNDISHTRGTISMARSTAYNTASSQFFIVQSDSTFLDGKYAAFGTVTSGMEIVDAICKDAKPIDDNGTIEAEEQPVITEITLVD